MYRIPQGACTKGGWKRSLARISWYSRTLHLDAIALECLGTSADAVQDAICDVNIMENGLPGVALSEQIRA